jgi:hypothetical protein
MSTINPVRGSLRGRSTSARRTAWIAAGLCGLAFGLAACGFATGQTGPRLGVTTPLPTVSTTHAAGSAGPAASSPSALALPGPGTVNLALTDNERTVVLAKGSVLQISLSEVDPGYAWTPLESSGSAVVQKLDEQPSADGAIRAIFVVRTAGTARITATNNPQHCNCGIPPSGWWVAISATPA